METVVWIVACIVYLWLACPSKTVETVGNQPKKGFKVIEIPIVQLQYTPKVEQIEQVKQVKRTVAVMRKMVRDLGIVGSARMNKQQLEDILN